MKLAGYLERIGYRGRIGPDLGVLRAVHRAHQLSIPFENLDVQLRRPLSLDVEAAFEKIVVRRRGGWCYEHNGLFGWALREMGFDVMRMSAGVQRDVHGDSQLGNHLCLLVTLDAPYLSDVGFGGSQSYPMPLQPGTIEDGVFQLALSQTADGYWRFTETARGEPFSFDFRPAPADEQRLAVKCAELQTDPSSAFVRNLVAQYMTADAQLSLRGRVFSLLRADGEQKSLINSADELVQTLRQRFHLDVPEIASVWPAVCARHAELFTAGQSG